MHKCIPYGKRRKIYESYWHCPSGGRSGKNCHSKGDQKNPENSGRRSVTDNIERMGSFLLCNAGFLQKRPFGKYLKAWAHSFGSVPGFSLFAHSTPSGRNRGGQGTRVRFEREPMQPSKEYEMVYHMWVRRGISAQKAAQSLRVSHQTFLKRTR